jgi:allophanate hydrolase
MTTSADAVAAALERIAEDRRPGVWIALVDPQAAMAAAHDVDTRRARGVNLPLAGLTLAVKDNIDVAGLPTTAGCPAFAYAPAVDAPVVAALTAAGAVVIGKTNLDQFATGLVGVRSPHGIPVNPQCAELIPGGSSSGSAVAVAAGMVDIALGTDTAGSGRVPAACTWIVGVKPTRGRITNRGVVPACRSLDCVSVFASDVATAARTVALAAGPDPADAWSRWVPLAAVPERMLRVGIPEVTALTFDGDATGAARFAAAVAAVEAVDVATEPVDLAPFVEAGALLYGGAFVAERYEAVGSFVDAHRAAVHPVVGEIIAAAGRLPAWQVFRDRSALVALLAATAPVWDVVDVLVVPSVPRVPTVAEALADPVGVNSMLGTYTNFVNLLDLCAVTVPLGEPGPAGPPASVTLIGPAWSDDVLVSLASRLGTPATRRTR